MSTLEAELAELRRRLRRVPRHEVLLRAQLAERRDEIKRALDRT